MRDCKKFCRPNLVKHPKNGDVIIYPVISGNAGIVTSEEYERIKKYFKKISDYDSSKFSNDEQNGGAAPVPLALEFAPSLPLESYVDFTISYNQAMSLEELASKLSIVWYDGDPSHSEDGLVVYNNGVLSFKMTNGQVVYSSTSSTDKSVVMGKTSPHSTFKIYSISVM